MARVSPASVATTVKSEPVPGEIEAYNLTRDPLELHNLANSASPKIRGQLAHLRGLLAEQRRLKRRVPQSGPVPGQ